MVNLFAYRATSPRDMKMADDPVGPLNDGWLVELALDAGIIIAAWGNHGAFLGRSFAIKQLIPGLHCLGLNKSGEPVHPLYQPVTATPKRMQ